nr:hypothetical protein [Tanacetum cinerariifolium]
MEYDTSVFDTTIGAEFSTTSPKVKTVGVSVDDTTAKTLVYIKRSEAKVKDKAMKLQEKVDEEERQRITRVHEAARSFTEEEWEEIRTRIKADEELVQRLHTEEREKAAKEELGHQSSKKQKSGELTQEELQQLMIIVPEEGMWKRIRSKRDKSEQNQAKTGSHGDMTWRLYDTCGVHHVSTKDGMDINMLVEREYPLSRGVLTLMIVVKLMVDQHSEMANELLQKIFMQAERPRR